MQSVFRIEHKLSKQGVFNHDHLLCKMLRAIATKQPHLKNPEDDGIYCVATHVDSQLLPN